MLAGKQQCLFLVPSTRFTIRRDILVRNARKGNQLNKIFADGAAVRGRAQTFGRAGAQSIKGAHWSTAFNRAVLLADRRIVMNASVLIQQQMP